MVFLNQAGFNKLYWGFLFIMVDVRINGFDLLPDIIGYAFFAAGFGLLAAESVFFAKARSYNIPMILLSLFSIYETPAQGEGVQVGPLGWFGVLLGIVAIIVGLLVVYNLFMGIKDMAERQGQADIHEEAGRRWNQYLLLQLAGLFAFVLILVPIIAVAYIVILFIVSIFMTFIIMGFMKRCGESL